MTVQVLGQSGRSQDQAPTGRRHPFVFKVTPEEGRTARMIADIENPGLQGYGRACAILFAACCVLALLSGCNDGKTKANTQSNGSGSNAIPSIDSLSIPDHVAAGQTVSITAQISGDAKTDLTWSVTSETGGGTFDPDSGTVSFDSAGEAELTLSYTAPLALGHFTHELAVTDEDGDDADASMGIDVLGVGVALFADPVYVDYLPGNSGFTASNLESSLTSQGYSVLPFNGITATDFQTAIAGKAALAIPWENLTLDAVLDPAGRNAIEQYVASGGLLIVIDDSYRAPQLLNSVFGFSLGTSAAAVGILTLNSQIAPNSPFASGPTPLFNNNPLWSVNAVNLPPNTTPVYSGPGGMTVVFLTSHGSGHILYLGWTWWDAYPTDPIGQDGGWLEVLDRAMNAAENGTF
jgi:hypothetical protein